MKYLPDTHAPLWPIGQSQRSSSKARALIRDGANDVGALGASPASDASRTTLGGGPALHGAPSLTAPYSGAQSTSATPRSRAIVRASTKK